MPEIIEQSVEESIKDSFFSNPDKSMENLLLEPKSKLETVVLYNNNEASKRQKEQLKLQDSSSFKFRTPEYYGAEDPNYGGVMYRVAEH